MKLLYCTNCKKVQSTVEAIVYFSATVRLDPDTGQVWLKDAGTMFPHAPVNAANPSCPNCDGFTIETVDRDECPHEWSTVDDRRWCKLCGKQEWGRIQLVA